MTERMTRRTEVDDFARIKYVCDPQVSPDGHQVAYVVTDVLLTEKRYRSRIWLADVETGSSFELTRGDGKDTSPRWSPDGKSIAFLTDRWDKSQIARLDLAGGEAQQVSDLADGVLEFNWTPDGERFLFAARANDDHVLTHNRDQHDEPEEDENDVKVITTLAHKLDGSGFKDGRRIHVGLVDRAGKISQLTSGDFDHAQPALSPDRRYLAFASNRSENRDNERFADIWVLDLETDSLWQVTRSDGVFGLPAFAPDSARLTFVGHQLTEPYGPTNLDRLWTADLTHGHIECLSEPIDREMSNTCTSDSTYIAPAQRPIWSRDGQSVLSLMSDRGSVQVVKVSTSGTWERIVHGEREVINFSIADNGTMTFTSTNPTQPAEVFVTGRGGERHLTHHNDTFLSGVEPVTPQHMSYRAEDEAELDAWLIEPADRRDGVHYPLVLEIHGGPHAMYGQTYFHEFQLLAAQGYGVLYTNPRGSTGYGQAFVSAAMGDWGGRDYQDILAGLDTACNRFDWIDRNRIAVIGGSYGGYMTNWMITQTDRFKTAITQRSTCNRHNLFGSSDLVWTYTAWEFRGLPWETTDHYYDRSPISYVDRVTTPLLIMHSENDLRCPIEQGEQLFTALKRLGKTAEFIRFPEESHNLSRTGRPDRRRQRLQQMLRWFGTSL